MRIMFKGKLNIKTMSLEEKRAYWTFYRQKKRCENPSCKDFVSYGKKGISVEYSVREFMHWYLQQIKFARKDQRDVGRIDHSKNYSIDNIRFESKSENTKERNCRLGNPRKKRSVVVVDSKNNIIEKYESTALAAIKHKIHQATVSSRCKTKYTKNGITFKYMEDL